ncbi:Rubrerythrin [Hathewaya proteolytica DSM 3090]|uniref:Rubrerythrin n=1 Tax=Hathewaya proteolytica DSM 3090 TaxID=1121331 RepID=A0A1M6LZS6_9CLOT|nr:rubrerythrin family protein [Hathewaya proteolytica]SHJ76731.1 Rubrerythrin [Hathewaya proteolytica DSM 3090]
MDLKDSKTKENLMRSFAGESQARNRYTFAADVAKKENYPILQQLFTYTADQERAHAWEFMKALKQFSGQNIDISAGYPAEVETTTLPLLKSAAKNENDEYADIYKNFANVAREEGFDAIADLYDRIGSIENVHSQRFARYAEELENNTLFKKTTEVKWICSNCGFILESTEAPATCPVCKYPKGYFMVFEKSQFE